MVAVRLFSSIVRVRVCRQGYGFPSRRRQTLTNFVIRISRYEDILLSCCQVYPKMGRRAHREGRRFHIKYVNGHRFIPDIGRILTDVPTFLIYNNPILLTVLSYSSGFRGLFLPENLFSFRYPAISDTYRKITDIRK